MSGPSSSKEVESVSVSVQEPTTASDTDGMEETRVTLNTDKESSQLLIPEPATVIEANESVKSADHMYASPPPHALHVDDNTTAKVHDDHTYAEQSDVPTEPYGSDSDTQMESLLTGISRSGKLILASMNMLEISLEYKGDVALPDATSVGDSSKTLPASLHEVTKSVENATNGELNVLLKATSTVNSVLPEAT